MGVDSEIELLHLTPKFSWLTSTHKLHIYPSKTLLMYSV